MPYLWKLNENGDWTPLELAARPVELARNRLVVDLHHVNPLDGASSGKYVLLWRPGQSVRVNGLPLRAGIHVLADRDEIQVGAEAPVFFSDEVRITDTVYRAPDEDPEAGAPMCPRCERPLADGDRIVRCPRCSLAFHYSGDDETRDCWRYAAACTCGHPTEMDAGFRWTPHAAWR